MDDDFQLAIALSLSSYEQESHNNKLIQNKINSTEELQHDKNEQDATVQDVCQKKKKIKLIHSSRNIQHLTEHNDKQCLSTVQKQETNEKLNKNENCIKTNTFCSLPCETSLNKKNSGASLTMRKNLHPNQIDALACARRVLFSCLAGFDEPFTKDPQDNFTIVFTTQRLYQVMKALHIPCTCEDVNTMMLYCKQDDIKHCHSSSLIKNGLCQECWTNDFHLKQREKITSSIKKNKVTQNFFTLKPLECDWNQFCSIFQACNLKVEKNGLVW